MPYNPGVQDMSGQLLAQGIGGAGNALAEGLSKYLDRKKKENDNAKYTEALFKNNPELQQASGVDLETLKGMSATDKIQTGMAAITKVQMRQMAQKNAAQEEDRQAQAALRGAQMKQYLDADQREQMAPVMAARMGQLMNGAPDPEAIRTYLEDSPPGAAMPQAKPSLDGLQAYLQAGAETGAVSGNDLKAFLGDYTREQTAQAREARQDAPQPFTIEKDPVTGARFARVKNTIIPSGVDPGVEKPEAQAFNGAGWAADRVDWVGGSERESADEGRSELQGRED
jgi:hypothetical protein